MTQLNQVTGPEPIQLHACEGLINSIAMSKEVESVNCLRITFASETFFRQDGQKMCMNVYDVRLLDVSPACGMNWPPPLPDVTTYLGVSLVWIVLSQALIITCRERRSFEPSTPMQNQNHGLNAVDALVVSCEIGTHHLQ